MGVLLAAALLTDEASVEDVLALSEERDDADAELSLPPPPLLDDAAALDVSDDAALLPTELTELAAALDASEEALEASTLLATELDVALSELAELAGASLLTLELAVSELEEPLAQGPRVSPWSRCPCTALSLTSNV